MNTTVMLSLEQQGTLAFLAAGVSTGGCNISYAKGIYVTISNATNSVIVYEALGIE